VRLRRSDPEQAPAPDGDPAGDERIRLGADEVRDLGAVFSVPRWLRDLGRGSWLVVGVVGLLLGLIWLFGLTSTITEPVIVGVLVAIVAAPLVGTLESRGVKRGVGAALVLLVLVVLAVVVTIVVVAGIVSQRDALAAQASEAAAMLRGWLVDIGVDPGGAATASEHVSSGTSSTLSTLLHGLLTGVRSLANLVFGLSFAALSAFFVLKDAPIMRGWMERHLGVPRPVAHTIVGGIVRSMRGYFRGVTLVAAFNAVVVGLGAWILGVPLAGTIAVVTFVTAYIPYIGAAVAGGFAVVLALGGSGIGTAVAMLIIFVIANGLLQNMFQPLAFGAALDLNPLVVLVVTVAAGCLFGMIGLVLAAPLVSATLHIMRDVTRIRAAALKPPEPAAPSPAVPT
jgi:putative heme transporter